MKKLLILVILGMGTSGCSFSEDVSFGPWDGFSYTRDGNRTIGQFNGQYSTLNKCMNKMTLMGKAYDAAYYCGYKCKEKRSGAIRCEKLMGTPI